MFLVFPIFEIYFLLLLIMHQKPKASSVMGFFASFPLQVR